MYKIDDMRLHKLISPKRVLPVRHLKQIYPKSVEYNKLNFPETYYLLDITSSFLNVEFMGNPHHFHQFKWK